MINLLTSILMISAIGLSCPSPKNVHDEYIDVNAPRLVVYDDASYQIVLSGDEIGYHYYNLVTYLRSYELGFTGYDDTTLDYVNTDDDAFTMAFDEFLPDDNLSYSSQDVSIGISLDADTDYQFYFEGTGTVINITFNLNSTVYSGFKNAIQQDINVNVDYSDLLVDILGLLTGGLTTVAGALGSGMTAYVNGLLIQNGAMSAFAATIFIFGGIALAFTLGRWVVNFISSLGNRNR